MQVAAQPQRDRVLVYDKLLVGTGFAALVFAGILSVWVLGQRAPATATAAPPAAARVFHTNMMVVTDAMTGRDGFPAFVPSNLSLPAHATVRISVTNYDDATTVPARYAKVRGTVDGSITVRPLMANMPNMVMASHTVRSMEPSTVSHTFTIPALGINIPIAPMAVTTFTIHTGRAGTYRWHCMDPCGKGATGWGTAMGTKNGFMEGTVTVG